MLSKENFFNNVNTRLGVILIVFITILLYANSLKNSFIWDDYSVIVENDFIKEWKNFPSIFSRNYLTSRFYKEYIGISPIGSGEASYRPIVTLSYFIDYSIWKLNAFGYHLTSLVLHILNALLIYFLINLIAKNKMIALSTSLFFAIQPVNTEAVDVISFREDLLALLFYLSSFILFIKSEQSAGRNKIYFYIISIVAFLLALFSKEMAITLPVILILYDYLFIYEQSIKNILVLFRLRYLGYIVAVLFYLWVQFFLMKNTTGPEVAYPGGNFYTNLLTMSKVFGAYILWCLLPFNTRVELPYDSFWVSYSFFEPRVIAPLFLIIIFLLIAIKARKRAKEISFAISWFFITLLPVSNIVPLKNYIALRYLYMPSLAICFLIAILLSKLPGLRIFSVSQHTLQKAAAYLCLVIFISYSMFVVIRNLIWKNDLVFWSAMAECYPASAKVHANLGTSFIRSWLFDNAIEEFKIALKSKANHADYHYALGFCYYYKGELEKAVDAFNMALKLNPDFAKAYDNLGNTYARMGKWKEASQAWKQALNIYPEYENVRENLEKLKQLGY